MDGGSGIYSGRRRAAQVVDEYSLLPFEILSSDFFSTTSIFLPDTEFYYIIIVDLLCKMSEISFESQESKTAPDCHERPPQYNSCQPSQDILGSVIENEHAFRVLKPRILEFDDPIEILEAAETNYLGQADAFLEFSAFLEKGLHLCTDLSKVLRERAVQNTELYTAMSRLTESEFNRTYASFKRGISQQLVQHEPARGGNDPGQQYPHGDDVRGSSSSCDKFSELSAKVDMINDKLEQRFQMHHDTTNVPSTHSTQEMPRRSLWKTIRKGLAGGRSMK